jgi:hypothetical protein
MITAAAASAVIIVASGIGVIAVTRPATTTPRVSGLTPITTTSSNAPSEGDAGVVPFASITPPAAAAAAAAESQEITPDASLLLAPKAAKAKPTSPRVTNKPSRDDTSDPLGAGRF